LFSLYATEGIFNLQDLNMQVVRSKVDGRKEKELLGIVENKRRPKDNG